MHLFFRNLLQLSGRKKNIITVKAGCWVCKEYIIEAKATVSGIKDILEGDQKGMCAAHMIKANNGFYSYQKFEWKSIIWQRDCMSNTLLQANPQGKID